MMDRIGRSITDTSQYLIEREENNEENGLRTTDMRQAPTGSFYRFINSPSRQGEATSEVLHINLAVPQSTQILNPSNRTTDNPPSPTNDVPTVGNENSTQTEPEQRLDGLQETSNTIQ